MRKIEVLSFFRIYFEKFSLELLYSSKIRKDVKHCGKPEEGGGGRDRIGDL